VPGKALRTPTPTPSSPSMTVAAPPDVGGNSDQIARMKADEAAHKLSGAGASRTPDEVRDSGVLDAFAALEGVEVPKSEKDRTVADDSVLVRQGLSKMTPEQIEELKEKAYKHPEVEQDLPDAIKMKHYGSEKHRKYGELIEELTGGVISAEEAMAMNPTGGLPGPGAKEIPLIGHIEPIARHAMRHDATGFLLTRFGVGPGYGSKTTAIGRASDDPLGGQILGVFREMFTPSDLPKGDTATKGERFA
jgi:hypothetical protein